MKTPILFIIFNRMDTTKKVFEKIREAKPPRLYIASDGARTDKQNEKKTVKAIRNYVISNIDWTCEIITLFRDVNKGCGYHIADAVT